jgi:O-antigen ligase
MFARGRASFKHGTPQAPIGGLPTAGGDCVAEARQSPRFFPSLGDLFSIEASFVLFLFAGRYKALPELRGFPIDFTLLFFAATLCLMAWASVSGRTKPLPLDLPVVLMISFSALAAISLFWSSIDQRNIDKMLRFLLLTSTSFFAAYILGQQKIRRERLMRMLVGVSCAILLYYACYRYVLGIDMFDPALGGRVPAVSNNYLEYNAHAAILFILFLSLAVYGSRRQLGGAIIGACAALFGLVTIGGRGPLAVALLAIPFLALGLLMRSRGNWQGLGRLVVFLVAVLVVATVGYIGFTEWRGSVISRDEMRTLDRYELQLSRESTDSLDERLEAQGFAFRQWLEKPLFGWGIGEFRVQDSYLEYPHNILLEILMEIGLLGAFLFFAVCALAVARYRLLMDKPDPSWVDVAVGLLFLTELISHVTVQGYLADDRYFLAYIGLALGLRRGAARRSTELVREMSRARQSLSRS